VAPRQTTARPLAFWALCGMFWFLPTSYSIVGRAYFYVARLGYTTVGSDLVMLFSPAVLVPLLLLAMAPRGAGLRSVRLWSGTGVALGLWFLAGTNSTVFNYATEDVVTNYLAAYVPAMLIYFAVTRYTWGPAAVDTLILSLSGGCLVPMLMGLWAYYQEWGIPDFSTVVLAPLHLERWSGYVLVTFGNIHNTADLVVLAGLPLLCLALRRRRGRAFRGWMLFVFLTMVVNLILTGVRTGTLIVALGSGLIAYVFLVKGKRKILPFAVLAAGAACAFLLLSWQSGESDELQYLQKRFGSALTVDTESDASVAGRYDAMVEGWDIFTKNWAAGLGPGARVFFHSQGDSHQFNITQGMELGVLGFVASVLLAAAVFWKFAAVLPRAGFDEEVTDRFVLIVGPAAYLLYGVLANVVLNITHCNVWICLLSAFLALEETYRGAGASHAHAVAGGGHRRPMPAAGAPKG
jgi:hypothetical protein